MPKLRVLVVGGGAREHALVRAVARSALVGETIALPGNAGIAREARCLPGRPDDIAAVVAAARAERIDLVVVGPEAPLVLGLVDALVAAGIRAFGPTRAAAELEGSKSFSKDFMKRHGIPTSAHAVFDDPAAAEAHVLAAAAPLVVKADGLAAGKGVVVANAADEALEAIDQMMRKRAFGEAGARVVIEERVAGQEVSFHAICDGEKFVPLAAAQDHKRIHDGDRGPNTGGMGAYSPPPIVTAAMHERILEEVIAPAVRGLSAEGRPFRGALFAGLMIDGDKLNVLEFNVRFGDPETAVLLARLDVDLVPYLDGAARGDLGALANLPPPVVADPAIAVVIAAHGYPGTPRSGDPIAGLDAAEQVESVSVLHAGTATDADGAVISSGGRVLCVTARGPDLDVAADRAYLAVDRIELPGSQHRRDIGKAARRLATNRAAPSDMR